MVYNNKQCQKVMPKRHANHAASKGTEGMEKILLIQGVH